MKPVKPNSDYDGSETEVIVQNHSQSPVILEVAASETGDTGNAGDENAPSFTTREEYNKILKDMGFNRTRIQL